MGLFGSARVALPIQISEDALGKTGANGGTDKFCKVLCAIIGAHCTMNDRACVAVQCEGRSLVRQPIVGAVRQMRRQPVGKRLISAQYQSLCNTTTCEIVSNART